MVDTLLTYSLDNNTEWLTQLQKIKKDALDEYESQTTVLDSIGQDFAKTAERLNASIDLNFNAEKSELQKTKKANAEAQYLISQLKKVQLDGPQPSLKDKVSVLELEEVLVETEVDNCEAMSVEEDQSLKKAEELLQTTNEKFAKTKENGQAWIKDIAECASLHENIRNETNKISQISQALHKQEVDITMSHQEIRNDIEKIRANQNLRQNRALTDIKKIWSKVRYASLTIKNKYLITTKALKTQVKDRTKQTALLITDVISRKLLSSALFVKQKIKNLKSYIWYSVLDNPISWIALIILANNIVPKPLSQTSFYIISLAGITYFINRKLIKCL